MKNKSFVIAIPVEERDSALFYTNAILEHIREEFPEFTISGEDKPVVRHGVEYIFPGALLTIGTSRTHDVEWVKNADFAGRKGYEPVLDLIKDWTKIKAKLREYRDANYFTYKASNGAKVDFFNGYTRIGYTVYTTDRYGYRTNTTTIETTLTNNDIRNIYAKLRW
jgi:hypothetical protein